MNDNENDNIAKPNHPPPAIQLQERPSASQSASINDDSVVSNGEPPITHDNNRIQNPQQTGPGFQQSGPGPQFQAGPPQMMHPNMPRPQGFPMHPMQQGGFPPQPGMYGPGGPGMYRPGPPPMGYQGGPGQPPMGYPGGPGMPMGYPGGPGQPPMGYPGGPGQPPMGFQGGPRPPGPQYPGQPNMLGNNLNQPLMGNQDRFAGDNRGLQNMQAGNDSAGAFAQTQTCCGDIQGFCGTYLSFCCCCCPNPYQIVPEGFSGVVTRFGKFYKLIGPGQHYLNVDADALILVDKRERVIELKRQAVVSKDNTTFGIDAVVFYKVVNTFKSNYAVANLRHSIEDLAVTTLRNVVGRFSLQEFLQKKDEIAEDVEKHVQEPAANWGAKVLRVLVQDVMLPREAQALFSTGALSKKIGEAQVITARADVEAARLMKEASDALNTEAALQIRYVDALESVSKSGNPKMIFFPANYTDVGTVNEHLDSETQKLL